MAERVVVNEEVTSVIVKETINQVNVASPGPQGPRGKTILNGVGSPADNLGLEGDFYYDKNNHILTDIEYRQNGWFSPFHDYVIWSSYLSSGNTIKAILDLLVPSIALAKNLKYEKIHYFEYDTKISDDKELVENSKLLDEYDYVVYNDKDTQASPSGLD